MRSTRRGFTVVETIVALLVALVVVKMAVEFMFWGIGAFRRSEDRLDAREKVHLALVQMRQLLCDSWAYRVEANGAKLVFRTPRRDGELRFDRDSGRLTLRFSDQSSDTLLIPSGLQELQFFECNPGYVHVGLELARPRVKGQQNPLGSIKMSDRFYMPSVALRLDPMPWKPDFRVEQPDRLRVAE